MGKSPSTTGYDRSSTRGTPRSLNPGGGEPMRDNPTSRILIARGMTIVGFARELGISRQKVSAYMNGHTPWPRSTLMRAAMYLGVEPKVLTGEMELVGREDTIPAKDT